MENLLKIGNFAKLTGSTLKTITYYHKIGLLYEAKRSPGGYRLYGPAELARMRVIKHLKSLGLDLKRIKEILGNSQDPTTLREVLQSLRTELLREKKSLEERVAKIEKLLCKGTILLDEDSLGSPSFQMIIEILVPVQMEKYIRTCPSLFNQQRKLCSILDDFQWGEGYRENFQALAEYFKAHPEQYQIVLGYGVRLARLDQLLEDDPEVEALARESAEFIKNIPQLREMLCNRPGIKKPLESLYNDMVSNIISPARMKHMHLLQKYLRGRY